MTSTCSAVASAAKCSCSLRRQRSRYGPTASPSRATARAMRSPAGAVTRMVRVASARAAARAALTPSMTSTGPAGTVTWSGPNPPRCQS
jgi:hypothetical protein